VCLTGKIAVQTRQRGRTLHEEIGQPSLMGFGETRLGQGDAEIAYDYLISAENWCCNANRILRLLTAC